MPQFPIYDSQSNINPNIQAPERHQVADAFKATNELNSTVQDLTQKWSDRNDVMQETKAKTNAEIAFAQQEQAAIQDPNPENAEMHIKAINDVMGQATKGIDNQEVAGQVGLDIQHLGFLTGIKIQDEFKKKQIFANDQRLDQLSTTTAQSVATAVSPAAGQQDEDNFMATLQSNQSRGLITPERANALVKQYKVSVVTNKILQSNSTNPDDYKSVTEGAGLDIKESSEVQKMVAAHIKQVKEQDVVNQFNSRVSTIKGIATGEIDWRSADKINEISKKDSKLGDALQMVFDKQSQGQEYQPKSSNDDDYANSVTKLFQSKTKEEISDYLVDALKNPNMDEDKMAILVNAAEDRAKALPPKGLKDINPGQVAIDGGFNAVERWNRAHGNNDPQVLNDYIKEIHAGKSPVEAYQTAIETRQKKTNPARSQYQMGQIIFNQKTGTSAEVVGFNDSGAPLVRVKHGKRPTDKPTGKPEKSAE
jgi:hypothetical protein